MLVDLGFDFDNSLVSFLGINSCLLLGTKVTATIQSGNTTRTVTGMLGGPTGRVPVRRGERADPDHSFHHGGRISCGGARRCEARPSR